MTTTWRLLAIGGALAIGLGLFVSCGLDDDKDDSNDKTGASLTFDSDVAPVLAASCSGSDCHTNGANNLSVTDETAFTAKADSVKNRLNLGDTNNLRMPPPESGVTLTADNKTIIINFLNQ